MEKRTLIHIETSKFNDGQLDWDAFDALVNELRKEFNAFVLVESGYVDKINIYSFDTLQKSQINRIKTLFADFVDATELQRQEIHKQVLAELAKAGIEPLKNQA